VSIQYSGDALELKLGLDAGVIKPSEVNAWADRVLGVQEYEDEVASLSLAIKSLRQEMVGMLSPLIGTDPE
jgi:hypothetical protein